MSRSLLHRSAACAVLAFALLFSSGCTEEVAPDQLTVQVTRGDLVFAGSYYGELEPRKSHPILAPQMRNVWQMTVETVLADGARVKKGDTVLRFARATVEEDLRERESELAVAKASFEKTKEQLAEERINRVLSVRRAEMEVEQARLNVVEGVNLISRLELDKAKVDLSRAELNLELKRKELASFERKKSATLEVERLKVESAQGKVDDTRDQLAHMDVTAPADGVLYAPYTRLNWQMGKAAPGVVVRPGDRILEIPELDAFNVSIYVRQRDATLLKPGNEAVVVPTMFPDSRIKARIVSKDEFSTTRNARTGTSTEQGNLKEVRVVLELDPTEHALRPGGTVRVDVESTLQKDVLSVPLAALKETGGGYTATLVGGKKAKVKVGQTSTTHAQIVEGLSEGDVVVLGRKTPRVEETGRAAN